MPAHAQTSSKMSQSQFWTPKHNRRAQMQAPCRRGVKLPLRREPEVPPSLLCTLFGNVTTHFDDTAGGSSLRKATGIPSTYINSHNSPARLSQLIVGQQGVGLELANRPSARGHIERLDLKDTIKVEGISDVYP
jgi:hypothetical protein